MKLTKQQIVYDYALKLLLTPYTYGGANPLQGLDCSQLVIEIASAIGFPPPIDMNAQSLYEYYLFHGEISDPVFGALSFYGKSLKEITHIGFCLSDSLMIEAGGGDRTTISPAVAERQGAFVKIRPIRRRSDLLICVLPRWPKWNE